METRKIYLTGGSTYVVSLPKKWVTGAGLKRGDSVLVNVREGAVVIEPGAVEKAPAEVEIKTSQISSTEALERLIIAYYLVGYDTIKVKFDRRESLSYKDSVRKILNFLIGVEIVEDTGDSVTMEILLDHQRMPTAQALKRIYLIDRSMLEDVIMIFRKRDEKLAKDIISREGEVDRLYFLVVRQLKNAVRYHNAAEKLGITYQRDALGHRIVVKSFERIADHIENISKNYLHLLEIEKNADVEKFAGIAAKVLGVYEKAATALFRQDLKLVDEVFNELKETRKLYMKISNQLLEQKIDGQSLLLQKTILDSLSRIAGYSTDIAEIAINMSIKVP